MRGEVLSLYRQLYRTGQQWPRDASKKGRDLGEFLLQTVQKRFREQASVGDAGQVRLALDRAKLEHAAMKQILDDAFKTAYSRSQDSGLTTQSLKSTRVQLSSDLQQRYKQGGLLARLFKRQ
jgi:hypothetical protein